MSQAKHLIRIWDLPTRLFHWGLVLLVGLVFLSASLGALDIHEIAGEGVLALVLFRLAWGVHGSQTARFSDFLGGFAAIQKYLVHRESKSAGHNPLGGWMVVAMLAILLVQAITGLIANDGIFFQGPLAHRTSGIISDAATAVHHQLANLLATLIVIHVTAILLYFFVGKENLLMPMLSGKKLVTTSVNLIHFSSSISAAKILCVVILAIVILLAVL
ncbi:cytochrome B [Rhodocyclus tenuis]|uniref:cytochrome b/b6 domain-containing protein n=1 Tax=Rhodocyclus gracilis TaxID=2929842 RepID=UPI001298BFC2|nr:cytochrome b/b6 domain-containing protein [Rhodocyclus gracilis]MRD72424.1 cytochrome B [Rhodocyclus gracilis]